MATSVVNPRAQFFANNGRPLIGGRIYTYVAGSSTRARTYKDAAKAQPNTNPIVLDGRGEAQIYLAEGVEYKFVVEDSKGALIYTQEPVYGAIWPNAADWPSDATLSYQYMTEAKAAAGVIGPIKFYDTYAQALGDIANIPADGLIEVSRDETRDDARTRYFKRAGDVLEFAVNLDQLRIDISQPSGIVAAGGLAGYSELRNYRGPATRIQIGVKSDATGIAGVFFLNPSAESPIDDGGTLIMDGLGRQWIRQFSGVVYSGWFGVTPGGSIDTAITATPVGGVLVCESGEYEASGAPHCYVCSDGHTLLRIGAAQYLLDKTPQLISDYEQTEVDGRVVRYSPCVLGIDAGRNLKNNSSVYAVTALGTSALENASEDVVRATAIGTASTRDIIKGYSLVCVGSNTLKWSQYADRAVAVGDNACINLGQTQERAAQVNGIYNGATTLAAQFDARYPSWRAKYWLGSLPAPSVCMTAADFENKATHVVAVGRNALGFSITPVNAVAIGYDALTSAIDANNATAVGDRCMQYSVDVLNSAAIGSSVLANTAKVDQTMAMGNLAGANYTVSAQNVMIGYQALRGSNALPAGATATGNVAIGRIAGANGGAGLANSVMIGHAAMSGEGVSGDGHTAIGHRSLGSLGSGASGNTALGKDALRHLASGNFNTAFGVDALSMMVDGSLATNLTYATGLGWGTRVSGNNQLQLGSTAVTVYSQAAVQVRSDKRDKSDVLDMPDVMQDFVLGLRPVQGVWDYRDDYVLDLFPPTPEPDANSPESIYEWKKLEETRKSAIQNWWANPEKDGRHRRVRSHNWFIAQEVKALADRLGIDFAGYQDHSENGGIDVKTLAYEQFLPPVVFTLQKCWSRLEEMNERLSKIEARESHG